MPQGMLNPKQLEEAILWAVASVRTDDWLPCTVGELRNRMRDREPQAANESINAIIGAVSALQIEGFLLARKREDGPPILFDHKRQYDDTYTSNFFARGSFELKVTHPGKSRLFSALSEEAKHRDQSPESSEWDVFISHASEDKQVFVEPLAEELRRRGVRVWYDRFTLKLGDSLRTMIDYGLRSSRFGVVVLSPNFFKKDWPQKELDGLASLEIDGRKIILPVWHNVARDQVAQFSPMLAGRLAVPSSKGVSVVADEVIRAITEYKRR